MNVGLITGVVDLLNPLIGALQGDSAKIDKTGGLLTGIADLLLRPIIGAGQGESAKIDETGQNKGDKVEPVGRGPVDANYCRQFPSDSRCRGGEQKPPTTKVEQKSPTTGVTSSGQQAIKAPVKDNEVPGVGRTYCDYFPYVASCQNGGTGPAATLLPVEWISQFEWDEDRKKWAGWENCGPASVAMVMKYYGKDITLADAAKAIRDNNDPHANTPTGFLEKRTPVTGENTSKLLGENGLEIVPVDSFDSMKAQLDLGKPVLMLVKNNRYVREVPGDTPGEARSVPYFTRSGYAQTGYGVSQDHIVVVTGYDNDNVYINDPLAVKLDESGKAVEDPQVGTAFPVPIETFKGAAKEAGGKAGWYGGAVAPK